MSDLIFMHLAGDDKPLDSLIGEYEKTSDKHEFVLALMAALLTRHRQWQALMSGSDK